MLKNIPDLTGKMPFLSILNMRCYSVGPNIFVKGPLGPLDVGTMDELTFFDSWLPKMVSAANKIWRRG